VLMLICFTSLIGVMVHGMVDTVFYRPQVQIVFWTLMALICAIKNQNRACY